MTLSDWAGDLQRGRALGTLPPRYVLEWDERHDDEGPPLTHTHIAPTPPPASTAPRQPARAH